MRLFFEVEGDEVAAFEAAAAPRVGETAWIKTIDFQGVLLVESVQHQFDRSSAETYSNHDVCLRCKHQR
jgi:hypothetical protein